MPSWLRRAWRRVSCCSSGSTRVIEFRRPDSVTENNEKLTQKPVVDPLPEVVPGLVPSPEPRTQQSETPEGEAIPPPPPSRTPETPGNAFPTQTIDTTSETVASANLPRETEEEVSCGSNGSPDEVVTVSVSFKETNADDAGSYIGLEDTFMADGMSEITTAFHGTSDMSLPTFIGQEDMKQMVEVQVPAVHQTTSGACTESKYSCSLQDTPEKPQKLTVIFVSPYTPEEDDTLPAAVSNETPGPVKVDVSGSPSEVSLSCATHSGPGCMRQNSGASDAIIREDPAAYSSPSDVSVLSYISDTPKVRAHISSSATSVLEVWGEEKEAPPPSSAEPGSSMDKHGVIFDEIIPFRCPSDDSLGPNADNAPAVGQGIDSTGSTVFKDEVILDKVVPFRCPSDDSLGPNADNAPAAGQEIDSIGNNLFEGIRSEHQNKKEVALRTPIASKSPDSAKHRPSMYKYDEVILDKVVPFRCPSDDSLGPNVDKAPAAGQGIDSRGNNLFEGIRSEHQNKKEVALRTPIASKSPDSAKPGPSIYKYDKITINKFVPFCCPSDDSLGPNTGNAPKAEQEIDSSGNTIFEDKVPVDKIVPFSCPSNDSLRPNTDNGPAAGKGIDSIWNTIFEGNRSEHQNKKAVVLGTPIVSKPSGLAELRSNIDKIDEVIINKDGPFKYPFNDSPGPNTDNARKAEQEIDSSGITIFEDDAIFDKIVPFRCQSNDSLGPKTDNAPKVGQEIGLFGDNIFEGIRSEHQNKKEVALGTPIVSKSSGSPKPRSNMNKYGEVNIDNIVPFIHPFNDSPGPNTDNAAKAAQGIDMKVTVDKIVPFHCPSDDSLGPNTNNPPKAGQEVGLFGDTLFEGIRSKHQNKKEVVLGTPIATTSPDLAELRSNMDKNDEVNIGKDVPFKYRYPFNDSPGPNADNAPKAEQEIDSSGNTVFENEVTFEKIVPFRCPSDDSLGPNTDNAPKSGQLIDPSGNTVFENEVTFDKIVPFRCPSDDSLGPNTNNTPKAGQEIDSRGNTVIEEIKNEHHGTPIASIASKSPAPVEAEAEESNSDKTDISIKEVLVAFHCPSEDSPVSDINKAPKLRPDISSSDTSIVEVIGEVDTHVHQANETRVVSIIVPTVQQSPDSLEAEQGSDSDKSELSIPEDLDSFSCSSDSRGSDTNKAPAAIPDISPSDTSIPEEIGEIQVDQNKAPNIRPDIITSATSIPEDIGEVHEHRYVDTGGGSRVKPAASMFSDSVAAKGGDSSDRSDSTIPEDLAAFSCLSEISVLSSSKKTSVTRPDISTSESSISEEICGSCENVQHDTKTEVESPLTPDDSHLLNTVKAVPGSDSDLSIIEDIAPYSCFSETFLSTGIRPVTETSILEEIHSSVSSESNQIETVHQEENSFQNGRDRATSVISQPEEEITVGNTASRENSSPKSVCGTNSDSSVSEIALSPPCSQSILNRGVVQYEHFRSGATAQTPPTLGNAHYSQDSGIGSNPASARRTGKASSGFVLPRAYKTTQRLQQRLTASNNHVTVKPRAVTPAPNGVENRTSRRTNEGKGNKTRKVAKGSRPTAAHHRRRRKKPATPVQTTAKRAREAWGEEGYLSDFED
ncbi:uncharacterized protein LOC106156257 [Lingula anatina]|uniref:Uncharacterized protein LOC106156257 n=1 Tax=Lingula anatina TaxID=7574 RepID=A0A1S3HLB1_LINAN|nr:uncharacterized protein LOC106156257 [Lingula anatina]|eukprot:XP_013386895.1 uncharacterized protein LOC106156257 [Lingula anatina]